MKTLETRQWRRSGVFIYNFEHISHIALVFPLLFEQVIASWAPTTFAYSRWIIETPEKYVKSIQS